MLIDDNIPAIITRSRRTPESPRRRLFLEQLINLRIAQTAVIRNEQHSEYNHEETESKEKEADAIDAETCRSIDKHIRQCCAETVGRKVSEMCVADDE